MSGFKTANNGSNQNHGIICSSTVLLCRTVIRADPLTTYLILLVLLAAVMHAGWNALVKSGGTPEFSIAAYRGAGMLCVFALPFVPLPAASSWWLIAASVAIHNLYYFTLAKAYRSGDLSQVYPLFRGMAPVLVALGAWFFIGEKLSVGSSIGIGIISLGLMSLALSGSGKGQITAVALGWGVITSVFIAMYTVVDGYGVRQSGYALSYILWLFTFEAMPVVLWLLLKQRQEWFAYLRESAGTIAVGGAISSAAYGLVIYAMSIGAIAVVSSLRETSVIFAALIGVLFLKEPFGRQRLLAASLVAGGIILLKVMV